MVNSDTYDSWEKLEDDLKRVLDYSKSHMFDTPVCAYIGMQDTGFCDDCKFLNSESCSIAAFSDILKRIRNLRGETHDC